MYPTCDTENVERIIQTYSKNDPGNMTPEILKIACVRRPTFAHVYLFSTFAHVSPTFVHVFSMVPKKRKKGPWPILGQTWRSRDRTQPYVCVCVCARV